MNAPDRVFILQESDGRMHYQWTDRRDDLAHCETVDESYGDAPRGTIVEYVRAMDVVDGMASAQRLERRAIVAWLREQTKIGARWAWNEGCCPSLDDLAEAIEKGEHRGTWNEGCCPSLDDLADAIEKGEHLTTVPE